MTKETRCIATIESDDEGELVLVFPDHLIKELGWIPGDTLIWNINTDNTITLTKA